MTDTTPSPQNPSDNAPAEATPPSPDISAGDEGLTESLSKAYDEVWGGDDPNGDVWDQAERETFGQDRDPETGRFKSRNPKPEETDAEDAPPESDAEDDADDADDAEDDTDDGAEDDADDADDGEDVAEDEAEDEEEPEELDDDWKDAPNGFHDQAKEAWKRAPKEVRAETTRRIGELEQGIGQFQETLAPLRPWMEFAQNAGTDIPTALQTYVQLDQTLRQDPLTGMRQIMHQAGFNFDDVVAQYLDIDPDEHLSHAQGQLQQATQYIQQMERQIGQMQQVLHAEKSKSLHAEVTAFREAHPRMNEPGFEERMADLINTRHASTIAEAYAMVDRERFQPAPSPTPGPQTADKQGKPKPVAQTRRSKAARKSPASSPGRSKPDQKVPDTAMDALERAARRMGI